MTRSRNEEILQLQDEIRRLHDATEGCEDQLSERAGLVDLLEKKRGGLERYIEVMRYNEEKNIKQIRTLENRLLLIKSVFEKNESVLSSTNESLKVSRQQSRSLEGRLAALVDENKELRRAAARRVRESEELATTVQLLTKEKEVVIEGELIPPSFR